MATRGGMKIERRPRRQEWSKLITANSSNSFPPPMHWIAARPPPEEFVQIYFIGDTAVASIKSGAARGGALRRGEQTDTTPDFRHHT